MSELLFVILGIAVITLAVGVISRLGVVYMAIGLSHRDKWPKKKK